MKKLLLLFVMMLLLVTNAFAVEVEIDGLWYDVVAMSKIKEAKVIQYKNNKYSGDIVIPETVEYEGVTCSVTSIEQKAFYDCKGLTSVVIGNNVITIGEKAFYYCKGLTSVTIGNSVTSIRGQAFDDCTALTSIYISDLAAWCGIDGGLDLCRYAKHLFINGEDIKQIRNLVIPNSVTRIGSYAFYGFRNLISVTIPNSVASIGAGAFEDCRSLTSVHISDIATWCNIQFYSNPLYYAHHLFLNGEEIKDLVIPNSVTSINSSAFSGCTGLTSITIPNSVTSIGSSAFYGCSGLTSVTIPNSVTSIGDWAFKECSSLTSVTIPNSVTSIGSSAFENCSSLTSVTIPNSMTSIGASAFKGCSGLTSVTIPNSVTSIGSSAFENCSGLTSVTIPSSVTSIGERAFNGCYRLTSVIVCVLDFSAFCNNKVMKLLYSSIGKPVMLIDKDNNKINEYIIPDDVTNIGEYAFFYCSSPISITIPNSVTSIGQNAFNGFSGLISVTIPNSVKSIGQDAFKGCTGLTSITIPNSVTSIGLHAFQNCTGLISVTISNKVASLGSYLFAGCTELTSVDIPSRVSIIGNCAFFGCDALTSITIRSEVLTISPQAFAQCPELTDVYCYAKNVPKMTTGSGSSWTNIFEGSYIEYATLHVPVASIDAYKSTAPWSGFKTIVGITETEPTTYKLIYMVDGVEYRTYDIEAGVSITPETSPTKDGYTFSGWINLPETMPAHDVTITGTFTINSYTLTYLVDGKEYKTTSVKYGSTITAEAAPTKEGYTFSGWREIPATMPAHDVTVNGTFSINSYTLTYLVDGKEYKTTSVKYGSTITAEAAPTKEGYTFSGWSGIPATMPAHDVTVNGTFTINSYTLTYMVDGVEYKTASVKYGSKIIAETIPTKEGYTFSGWQNLPEDMPAHDIIITGTFTINKYIITFVVDGQVYGTTEIEYGADVNPIGEPTKEGYTFSGWQNLPEDMPAHDITVTGTFTVNQYKVTFKYGKNVLTTIDVDYGAVIPLPESLNSERYTLIEWLDVPETMPARDIIIYADYVDGIDNITADSKDVQYIQMNGMYTNELKQGLNIIRMSDGTTRKVWVK